MASLDGCCSQEMNEGFVSLLPHPPACIILFRVSRELRLTQPPVKEKRMRGFLLSMAICFAAATSVVASTRVIPLVGHLPGDNGTSWTTDVSLTNNTASAVVVDLVFRPEDGIARTRTVTLDAQGSMLLQDAVAPTQFPGNNPASWLGQLEVRSTGDISASAHIFTRDAAGGTFGSTFDDFDPSALSTSGSIAGLIYSTQFRTNVAFANPGDDSSGFDYLLRREDGSVAATRHLDVPAHSTRQISIGIDVEASSDDRRLSLTWNASRGGYVIGSIIDNSSGDPTSAPSASHDTTTLFFPVVGKTSGGNSTFWTTSAAVTSTADSAGSMTFVYLDNGTGQTFMKTSDVAAHGTVRIDDLNAFLGAPLGTGSLKIASTTGLVASVRVFNTRADGSTFGSSVLPQSNVVRSSKVRVKGVRRDADYRLNVAISNDDSIDTGGTVRLFDDHGREVEVERFQLEHGKSGQVPMSHGDDVGSGEIEVETENGVTVTVVASNIDNRTGDTMQHESEQENERQSELEIEITPRVATVGSPVVFSLRDAPSNVAGVSWSFGDGSAAGGTTATHTYTSAGEFEVNAQITLTGGAMVRARDDLSVTSGNPGSTLIDFTFSPAAPAVGQEVVFTASGATGGGTFNWKFPGNVLKSGTVVTFTFTAAGSYEVEVELEHAGSTTLHAAHTVTVGGGVPNPPTSIDFTFSPAAPAVGQEVTFTASPANAGGTFNWKFPGNALRSGTVVTFTFTAAGSYEVEVELEHTGSTTLHAAHTVTVGGGVPNPPTSIDFTFSPAAPAVGQEVTFTVSPANAGGTFNWKFPGNVLKSGTVVTFTFTAAGSYEVEVELEHAGSTTLHAAHTVTVGGGTPNPGQNVTSIDFAWSPPSPNAGQLVSFTASFDHPPPAGSVVKWRFPDDSRPAGTTTTYTFAAAGSYTVRVQIEQPGQPSIEREKNVTVSP
jgi:hypothetical protein